MISTINVKISDTDTGHFQHFMISVHLKLINTIVQLKSRIL